MPEPGGRVALLLDSSRPPDAGRQVHPCHAHAGCTRCPGRATRRRLRVASALSRALPTHASPGRTYGHHVRRRGRRLPTAAVNVALLARALIGGVRWGQIHPRTRPGVTPCVRPSRRVQHPDHDLLLPPPFSYPPHRLVLRRRGEYVVESSASFCRVDATVAHFSSWERERRK